MLTALIVFPVMILILVVEVAFQIRRRNSPGALRGSR